MVEKRKASFALGIVCATAVACARIPPELPPLDPNRPTVRGVVYHDVDGDGLRGHGEPGLGDVAVSNGRQVVTTDAWGRYELPLDADPMVFVVKPRDWAPPLEPDGLPRFYHLRPPVATQGGVPTSADFALRPRPEGARFRMILFGDTQPYTPEHLDYLSRDVVVEVIAEGVADDAAFGMILGDLVGDDPSLFPALNAAIARIPVPWYHVIGNHDVDYRAADDRSANATFERFYGPADYAFQVGPVHFAVLDSIVYAGYDPEDPRTNRYARTLQPRQLEFLRSWLATVPRDELVVLATHVPLRQLPELQEVLGILSSHPHTLSLSGHTHRMFREYFGREDGYTAGTLHHHVNQAAVAGSWWSGARDELGVPHATMRDGAPNGWSLIEFDGSDYRLDFRPARRAASHQMTLYAPASVASMDAAETEIIANVFAGSPRTRVEMRLGAGAEWSDLDRSARKDPLYVELLEREAARAEGDFEPLPEAVLSEHLWVGHLPADPPRGTYILEVRASDPHLGTVTGRRLIRVK